MVWTKWCAPGLTVWVHLLSSPVLFEALIPKLAFQQIERPSALFDMSLNLTRPGMVVRPICEDCNAPTHPKRAISLGLGIQLPLGSQLPTEVGQRLHYLESWSLSAVVFPFFPPLKQIMLPQYIGRRSWSATDLFHVSQSDLSPFKPTVPIVAACEGVVYITEIFRTNSFHGSNTLVADSINSGEEYLLTFAPQKGVWMASIVPRYLSIVTCGLGVFCSEIPN